MKVGVARATYAALLATLVIYTPVTAADTLDAETILLAQDDTLLGGDDSLLGGDDSLLGDDDSLLGGEPPEESPPPTMREERAPAQEGSAAGEDASETHMALFLEDRYPSATTCKACHPKHYREWSVSQHAYAQLSPVYMAMQRFTFDRVSGTIGDFCIRCHTPIGMNLGESVATNNLKRHPTSREGITCVACHRTSQAYGKLNGRIAIDQGDMLAPVKGPTGNAELKRVLDNRDVYRVVAEKGQSGRQIHSDAELFFQLVEPGFCGTCHDVTLPGGFRFEEAFSEYKTAPANRNRDGGGGATCQDCHMGKIQGVAGEYDHGPAATIGDKETKPRKLTNHFFAGPDYSIVHPGIFPHNVDAARMASLEEWLAYDHEAGWGTDAFEDTVTDDMEFPSRWRSVDARYDAREIIDDQLELLDWAREKRIEVLSNGYLLDDIEVLQADRDGIRLRVTIRSGTDGHNVPTGFIAERPLWLQVTVYDSDDVEVFVSGDLDTNGDLRDSHSQLVLSGDVPLDEQLFSLQSFFIIQSNRGGEREQVLGVNYSTDPLPFVRPATRSTVLTGRPVGTRLHKRSIEPLGSRTTDYFVDGEELLVYGPYRAEVEVMSSTVPINLIHAIQDVGFDFNMSPRAVGDAIVAGNVTVQKKSVDFEIE